ncbi:Glycosyltransferase involved in cell wall bisynthesis [Paenibacillaceae bacterium GAS479]|nr:Glycosyltransferase involved in cell wall bisynthesis [Paenibacillaceae bacterium GAS479]
MKNAKLKSIVWRGPMERFGGLGNASRQYVRALRRAGMPVSTGTPRGLTDSNARRLLVYHFPPNTLDVNKSRKRYAKVVLNTVWETTRIPSQWKRAINRYDAVIVPSRHNVKVMRDSGVTVPVYRVPHGVNTSRFHPGNPPAALPGSGGRFVFLSVFSFQHRKNPEALLRAYLEEFSEKDRVLLVIKTSGWKETGGAAAVRRSIARYRASLRLPHRPAPIHIITGNISEKQLRGLYTAADAFVLPTRGEGVGMPFMEALASGIPVIATRWGGQSDFLTDANSFAVPYRLSKPAEKMTGNRAIARSFRGLFAQGGQLWAEADINGLKRQMRAASRDRGLCRQKGRRGREDMLAHSWSAAGRQLRRTLERINGGGIGDSTGRVHVWQPSGAQSSWVAKGRRSEIWGPSLGKPNRSEKSSQAGEWRVIGRGSSRNAESERPSVLMPSHHTAANQQAGGWRVIGGKSNRNAEDNRAEIRRRSKEKPSWNEIVQRTEGGRADSGKPSWNVTSKRVEGWRLLKGKLVWSKGNNRARVWRARRKPPIWSLDASRAGIWRESGKRLGQSAGVMRAEIGRLSGKTGGKPSSAKPSSASGDWRVVALLRRASGKKVKASVPFI